MTKSFVLAVAAAGLALGLLTVTALAQEPTLEDARAKFGGLTRAQIEEIGYVVDPFCVDASELPPPALDQLNLTATAAMGFHAVNETLFDANVDALEPEVILLGPQGEVWGVEYEVSADADDPQVLGQPLPLLEGGHPGMEFDHYAMHVWFIDNPNGQFADFNSAVSCAAATAAGEEVPVAAPALPAAGSGGYLDSESDGVLGSAWIAAIAAASGALLLAGWWAWRRISRV